MEELRPLNLDIEPMIVDDADGLLVPSAFPQPSGPLSDAGGLRGGSSTLPVPVTAPTPLGPAQPTLAPTNRVPLPRFVHANVCGVCVCVFYGCGERCVFQGSGQQGRGCGRCGRSCYPRQQ